MSPEDAPVNSNRNRDGAHKPLTAALLVFAPIAGLAYVISPSPGVRRRTNKSTRRVRKFRICGRRCDHYNWVTNAGQMLPMTKMVATSDYPPLIDRRRNSMRR